MFIFIFIIFLAKVFLISNIHNLLGVIFLLILVIYKEVIKANTSFLKYYFF